MTSSGHLVFQRDRDLWAAEFDVDRLELVDSPVPVVTGVAFVGSRAARFDVADDGTLIYVSDPGFDMARTRNDWIDREGVVTAELELVGTWDPRVAPDGTRIAVNSVDGLWVFDTARGTRSRVTPQSTSGLTWSSDGARLAFRADYDFDIRIVSFEGSVQEDIVLHDLVDLNLVPRAWSPDGRHMILTRRQGDALEDLWTMPLDGDPEPYLATAAGEKQPSLSSDGRYLAYVSDVSGRDEIYVRPFPGPGVEWRVSTDGGTWPVWSPRGPELFYRSQGRLMAADVDTDRKRNASAPRVLLDAETLASYQSAFDVSPDAQRFLVTQEDRPSRTRSLEVVLNWTEELKRLVPTND